MRYPNFVLSTILMTLLCGCVDVVIPGTSDTNTASDGADDEAGTTAGDACGEFYAGEMWGPCPIDEGTGVITLCNSSEVACVPSENGHMCLPSGACPDDAAFGSDLDLGWGDVCYPRCSSDADCCGGMVCDVSLNGEPMCAWPASTGDDTTDETDGSDTTTGNETPYCGLDMVDVTCEGYVCEARWAGTNAWSTVTTVDYAQTWPAAEPAFTCDGEPNVDGCGVIDVGGHVACWLAEGDCARVVAPLCVAQSANAVETVVWPEWTCKAGEPIGTTALCTEAICWLAIDPSSAIHPAC